MREVFEGFPITFNEAMNDIFTQDITHTELGVAVKSMAKEKAPGYDGIPVEFFQQLWSTLSSDIHRMTLKGNEQRDH